MTFEPTGFRTLGEAFSARVAADPGKTAVTVFRGSGAAAHDSVTYAELARRAGVRAAELASRLAEGERVVIALPTGVEFVEVYLGCLLAGLVAVPTPPPGGSAVAAERVASIVGDCRPGLAVTADGDARLLTEQLAKLGLDDLPVRDAGEAGDGAAPAPDRRPGPDSLAVLQYSSGSTGSPRGVMLAHGDVLANLARLAADGGMTSDDVFGVWLPMHHDMGLFGMLGSALVAGAHLVLMPPSDFVRRPAEWLRMMQAYGATVTAAPNFAFDLCVRLIPDEVLDTLDLSSVRIMFNGSEPIHAPTMTGFSRRMARAGLSPRAVSPAYGLAEATVYVSSNPFSRVPTVFHADPSALADAERPVLRPVAEGEGSQIVGVGPVENFEARIVAPGTGRRLGDGEIGEILLRAGGVGRGYWGRPEDTAPVFGATVTEDDPNQEAGKTWLRTGDLGAVVDGELFVTGRLKELLIVRGRNLFPQDVEQVARTAHEALAGHVGAAFGVAVPDERAVLVHEVSPATPAAELPVVAAAVTRRIAADLGVTVRNILLVRRGTVRRTTSGKIQRAAMRERFLAGAVTPLHAELEPEVRRLCAEAGE